MNEELAWTCRHRNSQSDKESGELDATFILSFFIPQRQSDVPTQNSLSLVPFICCVIDYFPGCDVTGARDSSAKQRADTNLEGLHYWLSSVSYNIKLFMFKMNNEVVLQSIHVPYQQYTVSSKLRTVFFKFNFFSV